jgi:hypothetical protein
LIFANPRFYSDDLSGVKVSKEDVQYLVEHMEIPSFKAERVLRSNEGSLQKALKALITQ